MLGLFCINGLLVIFTHSHPLRPIRRFDKAGFCPGAYRIPLFLDARWLGGMPMHANAPPIFTDGTGGSGMMQRYCLNRHEGNINVVFVDFAVRKIGLKELWTLKWHREFDINGPWTKAGFVEPSDWPEWMRMCKDY